jgi:hypothetical protein
VALLLASVKEDEGERLTLLKQGIHLPRPGPSVSGRQALRPQDQAQKRLNVFSVAVSGPQEDVRLQTGSEPWWQGRPQQSLGFLAAVGHIPYHSPGVINFCGVMPVA